MKIYKTKKTFYQAPVLTCVEFDSLSGPICQSYTIPDLSEESGDSIFDWE